MDLPIICTLTESDLRERRRTILDPIRASVIEVVELINGYCYHFSPNAEVVAKLSELIRLESQCCRFLTFKIVVAPGQPVTFEVSGPPGAKAAIAELFGD